MTESIYSGERANALLQQVTPIRRHNDGSAWVDGKRYRYHLIPGSSAYVFTKSNKMVGTACIAFSGWYPYADKMIAEYILIVNDEALYLETANLSWKPKARVVISAILACSAVAVVLWLAIYIAVHF